MQVNAQNTSPTIKFYVGDKELNEKDGVDAKDLPDLKIKVVPNSESYTITNWRLYIRRDAELGSPPLTAQLKYLSIPVK
ncbi:MAG: hypothetical protein WDO14_01345 [Bacteroidota bacterium]